MSDDYEYRGVRIASDLLRITELDFDRSDQLTQAVVGTFVFGMLYGHAMASKQSSERAFTLAHLVFREVLHYSPNAAADAIQECIKAAGRDESDTMNAILHRGITGHHQYLANDERGLRENLTLLLEYLRSKAPPPG